MGVGESIAKAYNFGRNHIRLELRESSPQPRKLVPTLAETEKISCTNHYQLPYQEGKGKRLKGKNISLLFMQEV